MMKSSLPCFVLSGLCAMGGSALFAISFHQSVSQELASPFSTQQVLVAHDLPQPWQGLLRWGGALMALGGGTGFSITGMQKRQTGNAVPELIAGYQPMALGAAVNTSQPIGQPLQQPTQASQPIGQPLQRSFQSPDPTENQPVAATTIFTETARFLAEAEFGGHVLFASTTGTGKTSSVLEMMRIIHDEYPAAEFFVIDPKATSWGGLHQDRVIDVSFADPIEGIEKTLQLLHELMAELEERKKKRKAALQADKPYSPTPLILILDEYPFLLKAAKDCRGSYLQDIINKIESLLFMGREDNIKVFIVSQSSYVEQLGFDGSVRAQLGIVAQGLGVNAKSLKPVINAMNDSGCSPQIVSRFKSLCAQNPKHPVIFSSIGNRVELAPNLSQIKRINIFASSEVQPQEPPDIDALAYLKQFEESLDD